MNSAEIDLIVPWVDGSDPEWQKQKQAYEEKKSPYDELFYRDWGLMRYWFRGVEKNLPWIRRIHFITWGHLPSWLNVDHPKLHIVRHEDYIPKRYLPTFSVNPIELNIHRIDGLADKFIYANDDTFFIGKVEESYYFRDGLPCDCCHLMPITEICADGFGHILWNNIACINRNFDFRTCLEKNHESWFCREYDEKVLRSNKASLFWSRFPGFSGNHFPNAYLKSTYEEVWQREYHLLNEACFHRFRSEKDVSGWLMRYWQLASGRFVPRKPEGSVFLLVDSREEDLRDAVMFSENRVICINEGQRETVDYEERAAYIQALFQMILPEKSGYERF